jgi:hypothetical protein
MFLPLAFYKLIHGNMKYFANIKKAIYGMVTHTHLKLVPKYKRF